MEPGDYLAGAGLLLFLLLLIGGCGGLLRAKGYESGHCAAVCEADGYARSETLTGQCVCLDEFVPEGR